MATVVVVRRRIQTFESTPALKSMVRGCRQAALIGMSAGAEDSPCKFSLRCSARAKKLAEFARRTGVFAAALLLAVVVSAVPGEAQFYAGGMVGVATLSGDTRALVNSTSSDFATYDPQNGLALNALAGRHLSDILSVQADFVWNRNSLNFTAASLNGGSQAEYEQTRSSAQESVFASALVYFRRRRSWVRPYLSIGTGWVHLSSAEETVTSETGSAMVPPRQFSADEIALRVPVGVDVSFHHSWYFRYSFSETLSKNPISQELSPPGVSRLKNFQNLFGVIRQF